MKEKYNIQLFDGHMIVACGGKVMLVDTGSPVSLTNLEQFEFAGTWYAGTRSIAITNIDKVCDMLGAKIDILLGMDVLKNYALTVDYSQRTLEVTDETVDLDDSSSVPITAGMCPRLKISVGGKDYSMALDTGAKISYIDREATVNTEPIDCRDDFNPLIGRFETEIFERVATIGDRSFVCEFGILPSLGRMALAAMGIHGVIGFDLFNAFRVVADFKQSRLWLLD